jgi:Tol biopolymer transport system component
MKKTLLFACAVIGGTVTLGAQIAPLVLSKTAPTVDQILSLKRVASPEISPDGRWVAYTVRETNWEENAYETEIWLADTGATPATRQLTNAKKSSQSPAWSPDGKQIAFESNRLSQDSSLLPDLGTSSPLNPCTTASRDIGITDFDGITVNWPVHRRDSDDRSPSWLPDGQHIVFSSNRRNGNDLYITPTNVGFDEDDAVLLTQDQLEDDSYPVWQA